MFTPVDLYCRVSFLFFLLVLIGAIFSPLYASENKSVTSDAKSETRVINLSNSGQKRVLHIRKLPEVPVTVNYLDEVKKENPEAKEIKKLPPGDYAAVVNGQVIYMKEYKDNLKIALSHLNRQDGFGLNGVQTDGSEEPRRSVINELINLRILRCQAELVGIIVPTMHVTQKISEIKKTFPSDELFKAALAEEGITYERLFSGIRDQLLVDLVAEQLSRDYEVRDEQVWSYYYKNKEMFMHPERVVVTKLVYKSQHDAVMTLKKIKDGDSFEDLQKKNIIEDQLDQSQLEDEIERGQLPLKEEKILFKLAVYDISPVLAVGDNYVIYKVLVRKPKEFDDIKEVKEKIKNYLRVENQQEIYNEWLSRSRENAGIKINPAIFGDTDPRTPTLNQEPGTPMDKKKNKSRNEDMNVS